MDTIAPPSGLAISFEPNAIVIRVERHLANPILSILLHSKFSDGPRIDFLTSPYTNTMIEALMAAASLTDYMSGREGLAQALAPVIQIVDEWAKQQGLSPDDTASAMRSAIYPYTST